MQAKSRLSNIFEAGKMKSFLHTKFDNEKGNSSKLPPSSLDISDDFDEKDVRIHRHFTAPKPFIVLKRRGMLFTEKEKTGFFACGCLGGKRKSDDVELVNRRLIARRGGEKRLHINFNAMRVALQEDGNDAFYLVVHATQAKNIKRFYFEKAPGQEMEDWKQDIGKAIAGSDGEKYPLTYLSSLSEFWKTDSITENEFRNTADTGDVLLFRSTHKMAVLQRGITASEFDHVAVVLRNQKNDLIMFESNANSGVAMCPWKQMIKYKWYEAVEKIVYRKLTVERTEFMLDNAEAFVAENLDKEFKIDVGKLFKFTSSLNPSQEEKDQRTYFCSELVAALYKSMGLIQKETSCTQFFPVHFSEWKSLSLLKGELGPEQTICFDIEPLNDRYK